MSRFSAKGMFTVLDVVASTCHIGEGVQPSLLHLSPIRAKRCPLLRRQVGILWQ